MSLPNRGLRLRPAARADLAAIWRYSAASWGRAAADAYVKMLSEAFNSAADNPRRYPIQEDLSPPLRIILRGAHVILFQEASFGVEVVRIRHQREDWRGNE